MTITQRLNHWLIVPAILLVICAAQWAVWARDRVPPFAIHSTEQASAKPGDVLLLRSKVRRDVERMCSAEFSRSALDSTGARFDIGGLQVASAETIKNLHRIDPDGLTLALTVPVGMQLGPATLVTTLRYQCNPLHLIWPIDVLLILPFGVI